MYHHFYQRGRQIHEFTPLSENLKSSVNFWHKTQHSFFSSTEFCGCWGNFLFSFGAHEKKHFLFFFGNLIQLSNKNERASFQEHWIISAKPHIIVTRWWRVGVFWYLGHFYRPRCWLSPGVLAYLWTLARYKSDPPSANMFKKVVHHHFLWTLFRSWFPVSTFFIIQRRFTCAIGAPGLRPLTYSRMFTRRNSHDKWFLSVTLALYIAQCGWKCVILRPCVWTRRVMKRQWARGK